MRTTRRDFLAASTAMAGLTALSTPLARAATVAKRPRYRRYNAHSAAGQAMMRSYAVAVEKMMALPPAHPHNWFRIAFVHLMDCPHGNWWFFVWHRGFLGFVEEAVRLYSGNPKFAFPFWDWTEHPRLPAEMFKGVLTPVDKAYARYTKDLGTFTAYMKPALKAYWDTLTPAQYDQLAIRGYKNAAGKADFDVMWAEVTGCKPDGSDCDVNNQTFAPNDRARYSTAQNPDLNESTRATCKPEVVMSGLTTTVFYDAQNVANGLNSAKTASHNASPAAFAVLEGQPHNNIHNFIGGYRVWDTAPYGNMAANLSPTDPIFFLHHANMDRLWDIWTDKQVKNGDPILPTDSTDLKNLVEEPFLFFVRADGSYVTDGKAGDYLSTEPFSYDYAPGFGSDLAAAPRHGRHKPGALLAGVDRVLVDARQAGTGVAMTTITFRRSKDPNAPRDYTVQASGPAGDLYLPGQVAFFGPPMAGMGDMEHEVTFAVPLLPRPGARRPAANGAVKEGAKGGGRASQAVNAAPVALQLQLVPAGGGNGPSPTITAVTVETP